LKIADDFGRRRLDQPDDWVCSEILHALQNRLSIIPILLASTPMPPQHALPSRIENLSRIQGFELRDSRWEADLSAVLHRLVELGLTRLSGKAVRYPKPRITIRDLTRIELKAALNALGGWDVSTSDIPGLEPNKRTELHRTFEFASFEDAVSFMGQAAGH